MDREQFQETYSKIVARAWADERFKERLFTETTTVLKENGIDVPPGLEFKVVESTSTLVYLILPIRPNSGELSAEDLEIRQAAIQWTSWCSGN